MSLSSFQRRRRELAAKQYSLQSKGVEVNNQIDTVVDNVEDEQTATIDIDAMTKNEIMDKLDELKIEYSQRDNKETLKGLLINANS